MKKLIVMLMITICMLGVCSCGNNTTESTDMSEVNTEQKTETKQVTKDFDGAGMTEMGPGTMYVKTAGGTSEDGNAPVLYAAPDTILTQIGISTRDYDGNHLTFVYVDGVKNMSHQFGTGSSTLTLQGADLAEGVHDVELVQYENDDPSGEIFSYHKAQYEVRLEQ